MTGKTSYIENELQKKAILSLTFLDGDTLDAFRRNPVLLRSMLNGKTEGLVIVDEVQLFPPVLRDIQHIMTHSDIQFLLTGSSARKLKKSGSNLLGGRAAEEVTFSDISTGASNDISRASDTVRQMITEYGMSERYRNMTLPKANSGIDGVSGAKEYSEKAQEYIDSETARILNERYAAVKGNLEKNKDALEHIAKALLEKEVLEGDEFEALAKQYTVK